MGSKIISLDGSFDKKDQTSPEEAVRLCIFTSVQEIYLIQGVNQDGVIQPMRLVARAAGSDAFYVLAQNAEGIILNSAETKAINDFFHTLKNRAVLMGGQIKVPFGDVSEFTGVDEFLPKNEKPSDPA